MFAAWHIEDLVALVRRRYPDWDGFDHPDFVTDEVETRQSAVEKARQLIGEAEMNRLLAHWRYDDLISRLETLGKENVLLWNRAPARGDLAILYRPELDRAAFALQMQKLLYGRGPAPRRLHQFSSYAARNYLPNKWTFPTYFLFLTHPHDELFVKPQVARWFLKFLGMGERYAAHPSGEVYALLRERAHALQDALQMYDARDMVDVQSFLWVCAQESAARTGGLDVEAQIELDVPAAGTETVYATAAGGRALREPGDEAGRDVKLPAVGELLEPLFQAFKLLGGAATVDELEASVARILALSPAQRTARQDPARGKQTKLGYRLSWGRTRLKNRGLIENVRRGIWQLTEKGQEAAYAEDAEQAQAIREEQDSWQTVPGPENAAAGSKARAGARREREPAPEPYSLAQLAADSGYEEAVLEQWVQAIGRKGQAIFYGPPGTGKTFLARRLARHLTGGGDGFVDLVQFHPAYAYEDFIQGIRPVTHDDGRLTYEMRPGRFLRFCQAARQRTGVCVLIVDEVNRANLSRVFGELMYLLEYREQSIPLAGGGEFSIPENVRLIGTMNTADRSIALVDHALRRRFAFIAVGANYDLLRRYHEEEGTGFPVGRLVAVLQEVNQRINDPNYAVGITFFLRPDLEEQMAGIWRMEIEPYLEEYFFDRPEEVDAFRWEQVQQRLQ